MKRRIFGVAIPVMIGLSTQAEEIMVAQRGQAPRQAPAVQFNNEDYDEQLRALSGRIDVVENQISQLNAATDGEKDSVTKAKREMDAKFSVFEEALKKLESQIQNLSEEVTKMREAANKKPAAPEKPAPSASKNPRAAYDEGETLLAQKKFREAILSYQKYRDAYPKGKMFGDATYKIGVCMQELGMRDEAKLFYDEVIGKFPGSKEAKKAAFRLKSLK